MPPLISLVVNRGWPAQIGSLDRRARVSMRRGSDTLARATQGRTGQRALSFFFVSGKFRAPILLSHLQALYAGLKEELRQMRIYTGVNISESHMASSEHVFV